MRTLTPQPSQILTVFTNSGAPVDITLDGGATGSFIKHDCAKKHKFKIWPNNQSAGLADSKTNVKSIGYRVDLLEGKLITEVKPKKEEKQAPEVKEENTDLMGASSYASHFEVFQIVLCSNTHNE